MGQRPDNAVSRDQPLNNVISVRNEFNDGGRHHATDQLVRPVNFESECIIISVWVSNKSCVALDFVDSRGKSESTHTQKR